MKNSGEKIENRSSETKPPLIPHVSGTYTEALKDAIFYNSPQALIIVNSTSLISTVNPSFSNIFGYSIEEAAGLTIAAITTVEGCTQVEQKIVAHSKGQVSSQWPEIVCRRKDGSHFWGIFNVMSVQDSPSDCQVVLAITDITEKKEIQNALKERDALISALYDKAAQAITSTDDLGRFIEVNPAFEAMFGYSRAEALKLRFPDITTADYIAVSEEKAAALFRGEIDGYRIEKLYRRKNGSVFWGDLSITAIQKPDGTIQSVGVIVDISERKKTEAALQKHRDELELLVGERTAELGETNARLKVEIAHSDLVQRALKESEERLRAIFETATDYLFIKDKDRCYRLVNPCMANLFEMPASQIIGLTDTKLFGHEAGRHLRQVDDRVLAGETIEEVHRRLVKGSLVTFLDTRSPMRDQSGNIIGICGISRDITERGDKQSPIDASGYDYPSKAFHNTLLQAKTVARTEAIVLLTGESGVGKDHIARYIHAQSSRASGTFYCINCGAIPSELMESELFGHERGAFTGATRTKRGIFELTEGGTVLLNEIGELPMLLQVKLLTFLDTLTFNRVGGEKKIQINARILAATNRNLEEEVAAGRFRKDLFYRLNIVPITVPPLRDRLKDIPVIARELIAHFTSELQLPYEPKILAATMDTLKRYSWPGNVRELKNAIERAIILSAGHDLNFDFLAQEKTSAYVDALTIQFPPASSLPEVIAELKHDFVRHALQKTGGVKTEAARLLGISRFALLRLMKDNALDVTKSHSSSPR